MLRRAGYLDRGIAGEPAVGHRAFVEEVLDVEMVHALAPDATLVILLLGSAGSSFQASGGGFSRLFSRPGYLDGVSGVGATRGVPDASADASLGIVLRNGSRSMISNGGGTSASAPIWAALIALADQYAGRHLGFVNPAIYQIARGPSYHQASRLGPGHQLGQPRRPGSRPAARPVHRR